MKKIALVGALVAALVATGMPAADAAASDSPTWGPCPATANGSPLDPRQRCATLAVPLDYRDPGGPRISLSISRIRSAQPRSRRGVLLLIPGGPGGSGLNLPSADAAKLPASVLDSYDLVGFDPRGVGRSSPVSCDLPAADLDVLPWPDADGGIAANVTAAKEVADACLNRGGPVLRSIGSITEARDIDRIRQALGENKISYWGVSYGTYVGAVYATLFASHTGQVVLDSNDDPDPRLLERRWLANYSIGVEDRFPDFAAWASAAGNPYRIAGTPAEVRDTFLALAARLDRRPLPWSGAKPPVLNGNTLREILLGALYSDSRFPRLAAVMRAALDGTPLPAASAPPEQAVQNTDAVAVGTLCGDVAWPDSIDGYAAKVAANRASYPLTAGMPVNIGPCAFWPAAPAEPAVRISDRGPRNVLLVQNLRDPATPYSGALNLRRAFGDRAVMITVDSGGHEAYLANGNRCGDNAVTDFLVTGQRPRADVYCPAG
ncbi:alpha/beta hydrolase [Amycolatopsis cynarae]|uniref:Alpha/beta hydrolase n=1 Tax=Amycolatopsis cynarae TaxID=2995223 RepID=A0ABY7B9Z5_9PSEU|nr:alpha/beta hydrolase [Amycolatopsis sp. HUAS 11-8]WAL68229.1 alpha/beta hydrolase [Amycolatopsis sp. HUAS 11-8]